MPQLSALRMVGVMGSGSHEHPELSLPLGRLLARLGSNLLTGGGGGVMAAVARAFCASELRAGRSIGILPGGFGPGGTEPPPGYPNPWVEVAIRTHLAARGSGGAESESRNHINILSSDAVVILPGDEGTKSELELALRYGRTAIAYLGQEGRVAGRREGLGIALAEDLEQVASFLEPS